ncbi:unnamed protein product [Closterium sp. NIES-53]
MPRAQRESGHKVNVIRTDNGGEFISADFEVVQKKKGIQNQLTEGARTLLGRAGLPDPFWVTALWQVALVKNKVLATVGEKQWVPCQRAKVSGSNPGVCTLGIPVRGGVRGQLGWLIWDLTNQQLIVSRDVKFFVSLYYKEWKQQQQQKLPTTPMIIEADEVQRPSRQVQVTVSDEEISGVTEDGGEPEVEEEQQQQQQQDAPPHTQRPPDRPRRDVRPPNKLTYSSFGKPKVVRAGSVAEQCDEDEIAHCYWAAVPEPKHKYGPDGELARYKSRLVAKGFQQTKGKDFDEIFALVGKGTTLRSAAMIERVEEMLEMQFKCSKIGDVKYYLGMHVERDLDKEVLRLHQRKYREGLVEKYGLQDGGKPATPLPSGFTVEPCADEEVVGESDRKLLASVVSRPSHEQLEAAKRLVRYVSATASVGLKYSAVRQMQQWGAADLGKGEMLLTCYTDASFNSVKADGASIGGYVCLFGGGAVSWRSKEQNEVGLSSCETEYMALHHGAKQVVWLRRLLEEIGVCQKEPTVILCIVLTSGMGLVLGGRSPVVLTGHADASWADDQATQRSSQGYTFGLGSGSVSWRATRSSSVLGSSCEAEIYAGAMAAQELRWLTYLLTDLGEPPRSPPVLYVDNKAMLALCREQRLEHRTKHIALRYFLARELQQRGQLRLAYVASEANTADVFTKALAPCDHQRCCTQLGRLCFVLLDWSCDPLFSPTLPMGWSLRRPVYSVPQAPSEWHDTLGTTLAALGFAPSTTDPSLFLRTNKLLPPFYVLVYIEDLVFATAYLRLALLILSGLVTTCSPPLCLWGMTLPALGFVPSTVRPSLFLRTDTSLPPFYVIVYVDDLVFATFVTKALALVKSELQKRHTCTDLGPSALWLPVLLATTHSSAYRSLAISSTFGRVRLVLGGRGLVVLTGHVNASWVDDLATQRSSQGYTLSLGSGSVSWRSTHSFSVLSSSCGAEIYVGAMAAPELRWLTYLLTDLGVRPRSSLNLYVDNKAMIALCQEHRLERRTKHIALRYFLAREFQQHGQLCLAYVTTRANTADIFTKALQTGDHQRFRTVLGLVPTLPHLLTA